MENQRLVQSTTSSWTCPLFPNSITGTEVSHLDAGNLAVSWQPAHEVFLENNPYDPPFNWSAALASPTPDLDLFTNTAPPNHVQSTVASIQQSSNTQPTRLPCDKCNKTFSRRDALKRHLNSCQANPRGKRPGIDCDLCAPGAKVFSRRDHLYQHLRGFHKVSERGIDGYKTRGGRNNAVVEEAVNDFDDNEEEEE